ncbi:MAG: M28 family peptidase [Flavobacterium sp.]
MKNNYQSLLLAVLTFLVIYFTFWSMSPSDYSKGNVPLSEFSTERALQHIEVISKEPHYVGTPYHGTVLNYLDQELQKLGLETQIQESTILSKWNNLVEVKNVITRIKGSGSGKAVLLLTHYDSAPHTNSYGASDDANGLGVILEGIRVHLHNKTPHKNDIIIVFSDAEELGLNGAYAFATEHPWADETGLVINFEARGTSGPSMMLAETNHGNSGLIKGFSKSSVKHPVSNSLMYSVYKMLPNDTDLTAFRETKDISGFNLAYIDDHFDYHTVQDNFANFTPTCLEHQATYLMPMLQYFANADLTQLNTDEDHVYVSIPYLLIHYPFSWNWPLFFITGLLLFTVIIIGIGKRHLSASGVLKGFLPLFIALMLCGGLTFMGWRIIKGFYPSYEDMLHGFTYNGHAYIMAFVMLSLSLLFWIFNTFLKKNSPYDAMVAPLLFWLILIGFINVFLPGASFLVIPLLFGVVTLAVFVLKGEKQPFLALGLSIPALLILTPLIQLFPVGLGLTMMAGSMILLALTAVLMLPVWGSFGNRKGWSGLFLILSFVFFVKAHFESDFEKEKGKPTSLLYVYDSNQKEALWATYDKVIVPWVKNYLGETPTKIEKHQKNVPQSKYQSGYSYTSSAPLKEIQVPDIKIIKDQTKGEYRWVELEITSNRSVQSMVVFAHENLNIHYLKANGVSKYNTEGSLHKRKNSQVLNYYPSQNKPLTLTFQFHKDQPLELEVMTASFDLLQNKQFSIPPRPDHLIPMPFVLTDAIVVKKNFTEDDMKKTSFIPIVEEELEIENTPNLED